MRPHTSHHHRAFYGLSCEAYDDLRVRADDRCELCRARAEEVQRKPLFIDHDAAVGQHAVRGLLCSRCNTRLQYVDNGTRPPTDEQARYLANAWHLSHIVWSPVSWVRRRQEQDHAAVTSDD